MATKIYFVSVNDLKENTTISYAVEDKLLENAIYDAGRISIEPILGTDLFNKIETEIGADTISGVYQTLLDDYIYYAIIKAAEARSLLYLYAKIREKGIITKDDQGASTVDITVLNKMRDEISSDYAYYANRLTEYLCHNSSDYPEYSTNTEDELRPNKDNNYFVGLYLGNDKPAVKNLRDNSK